MRRPDETLENGRIDGSTAMYNRAGFAAYGDEMLDACKRDGRPLCVVVFDCSDLLEVRSIYGSRITRKLVSRIARKLSSLAGDRGIAARTGRAEFSVVLPAMSREKALGLIRRVLGDPMRIELDAGDSEIVLVPEFLAAVATDDTRSVEEMRTELRMELVRLQARERRRRHNIQRERERHSHPMGIVTLPRDPACPKERNVGPVFAPTLPAPIAAS